MRILDVSPRTVVPPWHGSSMRVYHLLRCLSRTHEVRQFSQPLLRDLVPGPRRRSGDVLVTETYREHRYRSVLAALAASYCHRSWVATPFLSGAALRVTRPRLLREWLAWADVTMVELPWQFEHCRRERPDALLVLACHNAEATTRASMAACAGVDPRRSRWLRLVARLERSAVARADLILAVSDDDRRALVDLYDVDPARVAVVPNGCDTDALRPAPPAERRSLRRLLGLPARPTAVYMAAIPKAPDREGLAFVRRVAEQLPGVTFLVVGGIVGRPFAEGNLRATGLVDDIRPYLRAADISLAPIRAGGGTKLKVLDSLAAGLPTVAFGEAVRGTMLRDGEHVVVVPEDDASLVSAVRSLLDDPALAERLGAAGRAFVEDHHDWRPIGARLEELLVELAARRATAAPGSVSSGGPWATRSD